MARPVGQFSKNKEICFSIISELDSSTNGCFATDTYLGARIGCGEKQVQRYIQALVSEGRISKETDKAQIVNGSFVKRRVLKITRDLRGRQFPVSEE